MDDAGVPSSLRRWAARTAVAVACLAAARFVPFLAYVMSLIGSFLTISVSVIFPAACHLRIFQVLLGLCVALRCWECEPVAGIIARLRAQVPITSQ